VKSARTSVGGAFSGGDCGFEVEAVVVGFGSFLNDIVRIHSPASRKKIP